MGPSTGHVAAPRRRPAVQCLCIPGLGLGAFGRSAGVDVLSFGGTKNGAMGAEAVVSFLPPDASGLRFIRKQSMQLASKMRFIAAQFVALLTDDLWLRNALQANAMASRLADGVTKVDGVTLVYPVEANGVFAELPSAATEALQAEYPFYVWDGATGVVRWMCVVRHHPRGRGRLRRTGLRSDGRTRVAGAGQGTNPDAPNGAPVGTQRPPHGGDQASRLGIWCSACGMWAPRQYRSISLKVDGLAWVYR